MNQVDKKRNKGKHKGRGKPGAHKGLGAVSGNQRGRQCAEKKNKSQMCV
jgi:hypothetical protein